MFKGKDKNGNWHFGDLFHYPTRKFEKAKVGIIEHEEEGLKLTEVILGSIKQSTWGNDFNGTLIYEDDYVKNIFVENEPIKQIIAYDPTDSGYIIVLPMDKEHVNDGFDLIYEKIDRYEIFFKHIVVGNVWDDAGNIFRSCIRGNENESS